ncbi:hypothetical protein GQR58_009834 [Nymphon striatum]|nr:hypothetical protein GQR58_009834 [Nymphon striatum]
MNKLVHTIDLCGVVVACLICKLGEIEIIRDLSDQSIQLMSSTNKRTQLTALSVIFFCDFDHVNIDGVYIAVAGKKDTSLLITQTLTYSRLKASTTFVRKGQPLKSQESGADMAIETTFMRYGHSKSGIVGITLKPETFKTWAYSLHTCHGILDDLDEMMRNLIGHHMISHPETLMSYELSPVPTSMFDENGTMRDAKSKSNLKNALKVDRNTRKPSNNIPLLSLGVNPVPVEIENGRVSMRVDMTTTQEESDTLIIQQVAHVTDSTVLVDVILWHPDYGIGKGVALKVLRSNKHKLNYLGNTDVDLTDVDILTAPKLCALPPTTEAFKENVARVHLQVAIWLHALDQDPPSLEPNEHGWSQEEGSNVHNPITVPADILLAPPELLKLIKRSKIDWTFNVLPLLKYLPLDCYMLMVLSYLLELSSIKLYIMYQMFLCFLRESHMLCYASGKYVHGLLSAGSP